MRRYCLVLALSVSIGATVAIHGDDSVTLSTQARDAVAKDPPDYPGAISLYKAALRSDPANPYVWSDLASALALAGQIDPARYCYQQALASSGDVPQIWLRVANFYFDRDETDDALPLAARVMTTVPDYDPVLFVYFDQLLPTADQVFVRIGTNRRAVRSYTQHLIDSGNLKSARIAWRFANTAAFLDNGLTASYVDAMIKSRRAALAQQDWLTYLKAAPSEYPDRNKIYNSGFENDFSGVAFDWRIIPSEAFETTIDKSAPSGKSCVRITFHGDANVSYSNLEQLTIVTTGRYKLSAWVRFEGLTTNEGPRLVVRDTELAPILNWRGDSFSGTSSWQLISQSFTVTKTAVLRIAVVRELSQKFDNKIAGSFWLDDVKLVRD